MQRIAQTFLCVTMLLTGAAPLLWADTGFRNDGSGVFPETKPPLHWSATSNVVWMAKLKSSNASPIVFGDKVIACEEPDVLLALRFADGSKLWAVTNGYFETLPPTEAEAARENQKQADLLNKTLRDAEKKQREAEKQAKEKPADAEAKAGVDTARQAVGALRKQLEPLRKYRLPETHPVNGYTSPTPVTDGRNIYVVFCSGVVAGVSPEGRRLWARVLPVRPHNGWGHSASPRLADGLLLVHFGNRLFALDAQTGADKWTADAGSGFGSPFVDKVNGATTVMTPGGDFFCVADGRKLAGGIFKFPWNGPVAKDGVVYKIDEGGATAIPLKLDGAAKPAPLWTAKKVPGGRYYATSVLHDGLLYNVSQGGTLIVLDAKDGSVAYEQALNFGGGTAYPSPALAGDRIYVSCDNGVTVVIKPGRAYAELARNKLSEFRSTPFFSGDSLLIRTTGGLVRIQEK
jgi:outer membrane protein assembly factor BamB